MSDVILEPPIEFWNIDTQFSRAGRYINHPMNLLTIKLIDTYKKSPAYLHYSTLFLLTPNTNSSGKELGESVIFQPVLQAYPTCHSWIITVHVSLGNLECHWKAFNGQLTKTQQLLHVLDQQPSVLTQLLSTLQAELTNIEDIYNSCKPTIISVINLLQMSPLFNGQSQSHIHHRRSLLPFLGDALRWLTGTATTKDINSIKTQINQLIKTQSSQQENLSTHYIHTKHHQVCCPSQ